MSSPTTRPAASVNPFLRSQLRKSLQAFWNSQSEYWGLLTEVEGATNPLRTKAAALVPSGSHILDVACGNGGNLAYLGQRGRYVGCDISANALSRIKGRHSLVCGEAEALPFADQSFDVAVSTYALEHSVDPESMLGEICRVVRHGGRIVLMGPSWDLPFWYPNSLKSRSASLGWRVRYSITRFLRQFRATLSRKMPFELVLHPDALSHPFIYDADAVYVMWSYEVICTMKRMGCRLIHWEVDDRLLGENPVAKLLKCLAMLLPQYHRSGSTVLLAFEKH